MKTAPRIHVETKKNKRQINKKFAVLWSNTKKVTQHKITIFPTGDSNFESSGKFKGKKQMPSNLTGVIKNRKWFYVIEELECPE